MGTSVRVVLMPNRDIRNLNLQGIKFAKVKFSQTFRNLQYYCNVYSRVGYRSINLPVRLSTIPGKSSVFLSVIAVSNCL